MATIVCDTDFLIKISNDPLPKFHVADLLSENKFLVIPPVLREIQGLERSRNPKASRRAKQTMRVIENTKMFELGGAKNLDRSEWDFEGDADVALIEFVREKQKERILATMDGSLLSKLSRLGLPYLTLRAGSPLFSRKMRATYLTLDNR